MPKSIAITSRILTHFWFCGRIERVDLEVFSCLNSIDDIFLGCAFQNPPMSHENTDVIAVCYLCIFNVNSTSLSLLLQVCFKNKAYGICEVQNSLM